jgi:hypothetical protein
MGIGQPQQPPPGQVQHHTVVVSPAAAEVPPIPGIFQPSYQLTQVEFMAIQSPSGLLNGLGSVFATFAIGYALPKLVDLIDKGGRFVLHDFRVAGAILTVGLACFGGSWVFSGDRRAVLKRIKQHFKENPAQPEIRPGRR